MSDFADRAMAYTLEIKCYSGQKLDRLVTEDIRAKHDASKRAGRYNKNLFPSSKLLKEAHKSSRVCRDRFNHYTMPWQGSGVRILPSKMFNKFTQTMNNVMSRFDQDAQDFVNNLPQEISDAQRDYSALGKLFDWDDYPSQSDLSGLFGCNLKPQPIATADDFRVNLSDDVLKQIKIEYEEEFLANQVDANKHLWKRLQSVVQAMKDRLSDPKAVFRDTLIGNATELVEVMDDLNVFGDDALSAFTNEVRDNLSQVKPQDLRNDANLRKSHADKAADILAKIQATGM